MKKLNSINPNIILAIGGIAILYFGGRKILQALNIVSDKEDKTAENLGKENFWDYTEFLDKAPKNSIILSSSQGYQFANDIYNSYGYFNDDEEKLYGVFRNLKTKSQIASLCYWFNKKYNKDLYSYISSFLSSGELVKLNDIISKKPLYKL
jgi:hypothetical protein